jgi:FkbM family methyltransferase
MAFAWLDRLVERVGIVRELRELLVENNRQLQRLELDLEFLRTRLATYVGNGVALTHLADGSPIFVNADDNGPPFNILNGGRYEEENIDVLLSFTRDDTVFLDIGANVGVHTVRVARRLGARGHAHAIEPHPLLSELLDRNVYVNGLPERVTSHRFAASDRNVSGRLQYPVGHLGGGGFVRHNAASPGFTYIDAEMKRLDHTFGPEFSCDLVKIDVEGHELEVLEGMSGIIARSPQIVILFEKLVPEAGTEAWLEGFFAAAGFELWAVGSDSRLTSLAPGQLSAWAGYVVAARPDRLADGLDRARFSLHPPQLLVAGAPPPSGELQRSGEYGDVLVHGPYWTLRRGCWRVTVDGEVEGKAVLAIQERFGYPVQHFLIEPGSMSHVFTVGRDLLHFECAVRAFSPRAGIRLRRIDFAREVQPVG